MNVIPFRRIQYLQKEIDISHFGKASTDFTEKTIKYLFTESDKKYVHIYRLLGINLKTIINDNPKFKYFLEFDESKEKFNISFNKKSDYKFNYGNNISIHTANYSFEEENFEESVSFIKDTITKTENPLVLLFHVGAELNLFEMNRIANILLNFTDRTNTFDIICDKDKKDYTVTILANA